MLKNKKEALFLIESQPPHLGELISILLKLKEYDIMHICVSGIPKVIPVSRVIATWQFLLHDYKNKVTILTMIVKYEELTALPEIFKKCTVLTTSSKVYTHMSSLGVETELVPKTIGYCDTFQRTAYRQGRAYDYLLAFRTQPKKKEE